MMGTLYVYICTVCDLNLCSYYASLGSLPQQPSEGDNRGHAGTVEEEEGGHTLETEAIFIVTQIVRKLPLDVQDQTTEQPDRGTGRNVGLQCVIQCMFYCPVFLT